MMTVIINGMILVLLIGAIGYTYLMDLRVRKLLLALNELEPMVSQFSKAVQQSETSLKKFKQTTTKDKLAGVAAKSAKKSSDTAVNKKKPTFVTNRKPRPSNVGQVSLLGKSELVKSFFETAEKLEP